MALREREQHGVVVGHLPFVDDSEGRARRWSDQPERFDDRGMTLDRIKGADTQDVLLTRATTGREDGCIDAKAEYIGAAPVGAIEGLGCGGRLACQCRSRG